MYSRDARIMDRRGTGSLDRRSTESSDHNLKPEGELIDIMTRDITPVKQFGNNIGKIEKVSRSTRSMGNSEITHVKTKLADTDKVSTDHIEAVRFDEISESEIIDEVVSGSSEKMFIQTVGQSDAVDGSDLEYDNHSDELGVNDEEEISAEKYFNEANCEYDEDDDGDDLFDEADTEESTYSRRQMLGSTGGSKGVMGLFLNAADTARRYLMHRESLEQSAQGLSTDPDQPGSTNSEDMYTAATVKEEPIDAGYANADLTEDNLALTGPSKTFGVSADDDDDDDDDDDEDDDDDDDDDDENNDYENNSNDIYDDEKDDAEDVGEEDTDDYMDSGTDMLGFAQDSEDAPGPSLSDADAPGYYYISNRDLQRYTQDADAEPSHSEMSANDFTSLNVKEEPIDYDSTIADPNSVDANPELNAYEDDIGGTSTFPVLMNKKKKLSKQKQALQKSISEAPLLDSAASGTLTDSLPSDREINSLGKDHVCEVCFKSFEYKSYLVRHEKVHRSRETYQCEVCSRAFTLSSNLESHLRSHRRPYKCEECGKTFSQACTLARHRRVHSDDRPFQCKVCSKMFTLYATLAVHIRIHSGEKPYECKFCMKTFTQQTHLSRHVMVHTGEQPYKCHMCVRRFTRLAHLMRHLQTHVDDKTFRCNYCSKSFTEQEELDDHTRIHTHDRPYTCKVCNKSFTQQSNLSRHTSVHTGVKPFECEICQKKFPHKSDLKRHGMIHTGEKPHTCEVCLKTFTLHSNLRSHSRVHRKDNL